jgi:hypothetical protein
MRIKFLPVLFLIMFLASCGKELSVENGTLPGSPAPTVPIPPVVNDSILVRQLVALDTTKPAGSDTVYNFLAIYDAQKRCVYSTIISYDTPGVPDTSVISKFLYMGSDSFPYKSTSRYYIGTPDYQLDTVFYNYGGIPRRLLSDSVVGGNTFFNTAQNSAYQYGPAYITGISHYYDASLPNGNDTARFYVQKTNGNITTQKDTIGFNTFPGSFAQIQNYTVVYDTKPNPLHRLNVSRDFLTFNVDFVYNNIGTNNATSIRLIQEYAIGAPFVSTHQYNYSYRIDGYPVEIIAKDLGSTRPIKYNKIRYYYTK